MPRAASMTSSRVSRDRFRRRSVGQTYPNVTALHTDRHTAGRRRVTEAVRARGGRMFLQLRHGGRVSHPATTGLTRIAPSAVPLPETILTPGGQRAAHGMLAAGADLVALGRPFLANPDLVDRPRRGAPPQSGPGPGT
ncbi:hypothetical protein ABZ235_16145 [Streptomyces canus]|uniref:hypothetical protein n=1 Tax=Streptomyces canus TaxID=58343 RepID=UPI0033BE0E41